MARKILNRRILVADDAPVAAAERIRERLTPGFRLALSGGQTPLSVFSILTQTTGRVDWEGVELFWCDERCVPPDDSRSNYGAARAALLMPLGIASDKVHRIEGELPADVAARRYDALLRRIAPGGLDLLLLGVGEDGHTASLFPDCAALEERIALTAPCTAPDGTRRVSLTPPSFWAAKERLVLAFGPKKAEIVSLALSAQGPDLPIRRLASPTAAEWILDADSAAGLPT